MVKPHRRQEGISLLEILLALAIVATVLIYMTKMVDFVDSGNKADACLDRMQHVVQQLKSYYSGRHNLPDPATTPANAVPVDLQQLNLSQKHRLDPWGQYLHYYRSTKADGFSSQVITDIAGCQLNSRKVAGVLISSGPDQILESTVDDIDDPSVCTLGGDDIILPISLKDEAWDTVMEELVFLDKLVRIYDRVFAGVDNDQDNIYEAPPAPPAPWTETRNVNLRYFQLVDEDGCSDAEGGGSAWTGCIYEGLDPSDSTTLLTNDPNCGRATIDECLTPRDALDDLLNFYDFTDPGYRTDPWGNIYQWGKGGAFDLDPSDQRYHLFYSMGPDGLTDADDEHENSLDDVIPY